MDGIPDFVKKLRNQCCHQKIPLELDVLQGQGLIQPHLFAHDIDSQSDQDAQDDGQKPVEYVVVKNNDAGGLNPQPLFDRVLI